MTDPEVPLTIGIMHKAAVKGDAETVRLLHERFGARADVVNANGVSPTLLAAQDGHVACLRALVKAGADVAVPDPDGCTPLFCAAQFNEPDAVRALHELGADVNQCANNGMTPIFIASQEGHEKVVAVLCDCGADPSVSTKGGYTPSFAAASHGRRAALAALHSAGADVDARSQSGTSPLCVAAQGGHADVLSDLIHKYGATGLDLVEAQEGASPAYFAAGLGRVEALEVLHKAGADLDLPNFHGVAPVHVAAANGHVAVLCMLATCGADMSAKVDGTGDAPLAIAAQQGQGDAVRFFKSLNLDQGSKAKEAKVEAAAAGGGE
jgi:ankyrin repeat protein